MALETGTYISDLVATNPTSGDLKSQGDDHLRLIKATILASFPNITGAATLTHGQLSGVSTPFTGTPTAPTAAAGTNTTQIATTAFVTAAFVAEAYPPISGNSGKFLTTDGNITSWGDVYTESEIDATFALYYTKTEIDASFALYYTQTEIDANIYTKTEIDANTYTQTEVDTLVSSPVNTLGALGSVSGATAVDFDTYDTVTLTLTGATTISFSAFPTGKTASLIIDSGDEGVTWPAGVLWPEGTEPTLTAGIDRVVIQKTATGVYYASLAGQAYA